MPLNIEIVETNRQIEQLILRDIVSELNRVIPTKLKGIDTKVREATFNFIRATTTYNSLVNGELAAHFGIPYIGRQQRIDNIVSAVSNRIEITYKPIRLIAGRFAHGIRFGVLLTNLSEVLGLPDGQILTRKGQVLPWLEWLLVLGDTIEISEYEIKLWPGKGRSGGGIMISDKGGSWRVPPQFSGTLNDNWLTRAFKNNIQSYSSIIEKIIQSELQGI